MNIRQYNRYLFSMCGLAGLLYGIDVGLIASALPYIRATCSFTEVQLASIVSAVLLGAVPGKLLAGFVSERFGRLTAFRLTAVVFAAAVPMICLSHGVFWLMFTGRLLQGIGVALVGISSPLYMAECARAEDRGRGTGMIQLVLTVGLVVAALVGYAVTRFYGPADSAAVTFEAKTSAWQMIFWLSIIPTAFLFLGSLRLKESPRWLFRKGRERAALDALLANNDRRDAEAILEGMRNNSDLSRQGSDAKIGDGGTLLRRKYVLPFVIALLVMCFTQATGVNSLLNYSVVILQKAGSAGANANLADAAIKLANFVMTAVALALIDRKGRKVLLTIGTAGVVIGLLFVGGLFLAIERGMISACPMTGCLVAVGLIVYIAAYGLGPGVCVWLAVSELMPIRIRSGGMTVTGICSMCIGWAIAQAFLPWSKAFGESSVFFTLGGIAVLYFLTARYLLPETKGRSLEEIERYFSKE